MSIIYGDIMDVVIVKKVLRELEKSSASINELASAIGIGWKTCENYLESLKIAGVVEETRTKNQRIFSLSKRKPRWLFPAKKRLEGKITWVRETP
jgi:predicted transcriptional regulator